MHYSCMQKHILNNAGTFQYPFQYGHHKLLLNSNHMLAQSPQPIQFFSTRKDIKLSPLNIQIKITAK